MEEHHIKIAIVGNGPWGVAALDHCIATAFANADIFFDIFLIGPTEPGIWSQECAEEDYLLLNTIAAQIDGFSSEHFGEKSYEDSRSFLSWHTKFRNKQINPNAFVSRSLYGEYLRFVHKTLVANCPNNMRIRHLKDIVNDIQISKESNVSVITDSENIYSVHHALICTGYGLPTSDKNCRSFPLRAPYPTKNVLSNIESGNTVGVQGIGLVSVDIVAMLTEGLGGKFIRDTNNTIVYVPSGREPTIHVYSRSGRPFHCRPKTVLDKAEFHRPIFCTKNYFQNLRSDLGDTGISLHQHLIPVLYAEMWLAYTKQFLKINSNTTSAENLLLEANNLPLGKIENLCKRYLEDSDRFDPQVILNLNAKIGGHDPDSFSSTFVSELSFDVSESLKGELASPYKHAIETLRTLRDIIRFAVEFGTLDDESHATFFEKLGPRMSQLTVGPPVSRGEEWLELIGCGLLKVQLGPSPSIVHGSFQKPWRAIGNFHQQPQPIYFDHHIEGHVGNKFSDSEANPIIANMKASGVLSFSSCGTSHLLNLDRNSHPISEWGHIQRSLTLLGVPTEGATYYNHYIPSLGGRSLAFKKIQLGLNDMLTDFRSQTAVQFAPNQPAKSID